MNLNNPILIGIIIGGIIYVLLYLFNTNKDDDDKNQNKIKQNIIISLIIGAIICIIWYFTTNIYQIKTPNKYIIPKISSQSQFIGDVIEKINMPKQLPNINI